MHIYAHQLKPWVIGMYHDGYNAMALFIKVKGGLITSVKSGDNMVKTQQQHSVWMQ